MSSVCRCTVCLQTFASVRSFDRHRVGDIYARRCLSRQEMLAANFRWNEQKGVWLYGKQDRIPHGTPNAL